MEFRRTILGGTVLSVCEHDGSWDGGGGVFGMIDRTGGMLFGIVKSKHANQDLSLIHI